MTRTPRIPRLSLTKKTAAYAGAGLALAAVTGATTAAGFAGQDPARADSVRPAVSRTLHAVPATTGPATTGSAAHTSPAKQAAPTKRTAPGKHTAPARHTGPAKHTAPVMRAAPAKKSAPAKHAPTHHARTWAEVRKIVAKRTDPKAGHGPLPARDQLTPVGTSGPQTWMPITPARWENAKTIVRQAIDKHMGLRSAVIAVATSMQESTLLNLGYGDRDSLGLFQQRPSCGWGTPGQIKHPAYAADAFLKALHGYQSSNPGWAHRPLWEAAQGVQGSAFPSAYAKWEAQAAHLVASVTKHLV
ncbi:MAG TPA: hypothetical protein VFW16_10135 [Streptosporangiaceae bacterium]|nr:hypothetical protein [Streptosporangiaceae bacterium]